MGITTKDSEMRFKMLCSEVSCENVIWFRIIFTLPCVYPDFSCDLENSRNIIGK